MPRKLSSPLTEDDKAWLRSWNRGDEIPEDDEAEQAQDTTPDPNPQTPTGESDGTGDGEQSGNGDPFDGEEPPEDYNDWSVKQLQFELGERQLPKSGNKEELVKRLQEDDEANPE